MDLRSAGFKRLQRFLDQEQSEEMIAEVNKEEMNQNLFKSQKILGPHGWTVEFLVSMK